MANGGTKIYCPGCKFFSVCKAISPTNIGKPRAQRWYRTDFQDIAWFRRGRVCLDCGHKFLSAEVDEVFIEELVELRRRLAKKQKAAIKKIRRNVPWLKCSETIPLELAKRLIRASTWWLTHSSGSPIRAPGYAERIYKSHHGWAVDFGANTFLVGKVIERCRIVINDYLNDVSKGRIPLKSEVTASLRKEISRSVANVDGYEYKGDYPVNHQYLVFGAQSIDVSDAVKFILYESGIENLLLDT